MADHCRITCCVLSSWMVFACWPVVSLADEPVKLPPAVTRKVDFATDVKPIFERRCLECHGPQKQLGGLRLDQRRTALGESDSGLAILPGKSAESLLVQLVAGLEADRWMPQKGERLTAAEVGILRAWIDAGAVWPDDGSETAAAQHWSLQPVVRPALPPAPVGARNPIDHFIAEALAEKQLTLSPEADPRTLLRRLSFDLVGLPPAPEEVAAFLAAHDTRAYDRVVDRLLASPHHGERWAQHWLDAVRFAESDGFEKNLPRASAWPYRDYVIASFNADKPYHQFLREQLAGDVLEAPTATGFLVGGANDTVKSREPVLNAQQRADVLHDMVSTTASAMLGLTVGCARCHNHKFDPIPQADYYRMKAVFEGVAHGERVIGDQTQQKAELARTQQALEAVQAALAQFEPLADPATQHKTLREAVNPRLNSERFSATMAKRLRFTVRATTGGEPCIDELEVYAAADLTQNVALASFGTQVQASSVYANSTSPLHKLEHINDGKHGNARSWISGEAGRGWIELDFKQPVSIDRIVWGRDRELKYRDRLPTDYTIEVAGADDAWKVVASSADRQKYANDKKSPLKIDETKLTSEQLARYRELAARHDALNKELQRHRDAPKFYLGLFENSPPPTHRFHRGDPMQPRDRIEPGALRTISVGFNLPPSTGNRSLTSDQQRRLALAEWIVDPANPLTARVMVNRLWQQHFGEGLVGTPSDFGVNGARPTHPALLDWLSAELVEHGWSLRHVHRLIVQSATYRQSSAARAEGLSADAGSRLLWRYPPRRLEAEPIRDTILAVSGKLDLRMGGPGFLAFEPNSNYVRVYNPKTTFGPEDWRRMVYMTKIRMQQDGAFGAFDCPDGGQIAPRRSRSTTPLQALSLLNSPFLAEQAEFFAERVAKDAGDDPAAQVKRAFRLVYQREPAAAELVECERLVRDFGLPVLGRVLFNSNEFLYVF